MTVPSGKSREGLPIGVQLIARDEATALTCAKRVEATVHASGEDNAKVAQRAGGLAVVDLTGGDNLAHA